MQGGWQGPMGSVGGLTRTYGLQKTFEKNELEGPPPDLTPASLRRICAYFKPYWKEWLLILACIATNSALSVLPPFCVGIILDRALPQGDATLLGILSGAMVGLALISGLMGVFQLALTARAGQSIVFDLRNELYRHLQRMSLHFFTTTRSGEIVSRVNSDVNSVQNVATGTLVAIASNSTTLIATSIALFTMNWKLALAAVVVVPAFYLPSKIIGGIRRRLSARTQAQEAAMLTFLNERLHVGGSILANIFGQNPQDAATFSGSAEEIKELQIKQAVVGRWLFMILSVFSAMGPALIYWYGGHQVIQKELTPGLLVAFAALLTLLYRPMMQLAGVYVDIQAAFAVFDRIFDYLDMKPDVVDRAGALPMPVVQGRIVFEDVRFLYSGHPATRRRADAGAGEPEEGTPAPFALQGISLEIQPGEQVALVGPSGAGKTTITYLVPRFYDPTAGRILLDGHDLRDLQQDELRRHLGMVTQETFLFHASIRENLRYARPTVSDAEMHEACMAAHIHDFIAALPAGYDTVVGERGFRLSGGEKQRVSIARTLIKNPAILILDEATSSLDATSESLIQEALAELLKNRTSLIIAHRLSTILSSDKIVVLDEGRIVEVGPHNVLVNQDGLYAKLFRQQFGKALSANQP